MKKNHFSRIELKVACNDAHTCIRKTESTKDNYLRRANDDVVNRNKDELNEESNESHHYKTDCCTERHLREL